VSKGPEAGRKRPTYRFLEVVRMDMSLEASKASCRSPEVRSEAEESEAMPILWGPFDSLVGLVRSG
jgi:hypothetical protein